MSKLKFEGFSRPHKFEIAPIRLADCISKVIIENDSPAISLEDLDKKYNIQAELINKISNPRMKC